MKLCFTLMVGVLAAAAQSGLPPKTYSQTCPALSFEQSLITSENRILVKFQPTDPNLRFDFVTLHVVLENTKGIPISEVRNYDMRTQQMGRPSYYLGELLDPIHIEAIRSRRLGTTLRYSFTYCVRLPAGSVAKNADCDTEIFDYKPITFAWRALPAECPTECGMPAQTITVPAECLGSDNEVYSDQACQGLSRPAALECPATEPCVTFQWVAERVICPSECGLDSSKVVPDAYCQGSDLEVYSGDKCANLPRPLAVHCPSTPDCVTFRWVAEQIACPTECGLQAQKIVPDAYCQGSDNQVYTGDKCANLPRPPAVHCPKTKDCVTYRWVAEDVTCPTECGLEAQRIEPPAYCQGSDNQIYSGEMCANLARPSAVYCPATESCVVHDWRAALVECPQECGLPASVITPDVSCTGSDGQVYPDEQCLGKPRPRITCPATELCPLEPLRKICPAIEYDQRVTRSGSDYLLTFTPKGKDIHRRNIEWVDVHFSVEDRSGNQVQTLQNHRMDRPAMNKNAMDFTYRLSSLDYLLRVPGWRLVYSFTYCVEMIDCDTRKFYFSP